MCFSLCLSLTHTYTHSLESKRSGCWRKGTTTIAFQKNAEWSRVQTCTKLAKICSKHKQMQERWNTIQLQTNNTLLRLVLKAPSSILEQNIKHSCFVHLAEFSSWIIVLFKQKRALKIAGFRWEERHEFYSTTKHMELTEIGGNWISEWYVQKKQQSLN